MKKELVKTRTYDISNAGMSPIEDEVQVELFESIIEAATVLGQEECLRILNQYRITHARRLWRENKIKELHPPTRTSRLKTW